MSTGSCCPCDCDSVSETCVHVQALVVPSELIEEQLGDMADYIEDADENLQVCIVILAGSHHLLSIVHSILYVAMSCKMRPQFIQNV